MGIPVTLHQFWWRTCEVLPIMLLIGLSLLLRLWESPGKKSDVRSVKRA